MDPVSRAQSGNTQESRLSRFGDKLQKPWQQGQSGNPSGRPKSRRITRIYKRILADSDNRQAIEDAIINTLTGDSRMAAVLMLREMAERTEGRITQEIELSGSISTMNEDQINERLAKLLAIDVTPTNEPGSDTLTTK